MDTPDTELPKAEVLMSYPAATSVAFAAIAVAGLLFIASRFDATRGTLTISLLVAVTFIGALGLSLRFTIPQDPETAALIGGVIAAMGAVITYWLTPRGKD